MTERALTAEAAYVGSLLWLPADVARTAAGWLTADDFTDPQIAAIYGLVIQLVDAGVTPDPSAVLAAARAAGGITGQDQVRRFTTTLARLYDHRATVPVNVRWYAANALGDALRRRITEMGTRLVQAAASCALEDLDELQQRESAAVATLRRRYLHLLPSNAHSPGLAA